jgi:spermidine/putrescine transport system substrate-binding protein
VNPRPSASSPRALSRRQFLLRSGAIGAAGLSLPALLAACGGDDGDGASTTTGAGSDTTAPAATGKLYFENWPAYIDEETVGLFAEATGIDFRYTEAFNDNNEYFAKIQPLLGSGKTIEPDMIAPTFWMAARLVNLGWVDELPIDQIPNRVNLEDSFKGAAWDPDNRFNMPWQGGIAGIAYNIAQTGRELTSVADLFDQAFKGKIFMLTEMRDTVGVVLLGEGGDPSTVASLDDVAPALDKIAAAKASGQIRAFTGNDYLDDLGAGNFTAGIAWSGDIMQLQLDNPDIRFAIPEEGATLWYDTMVVPKGAKNRVEIAKWIDYVYDPVNAARIAAYVNYISPVKGVREALEAMGGDAAALTENPLMFPTDEDRTRLKTFASLSEDVEAEIDAEFAKIVGA